MKKVYFASDFHLGVDADCTSRQREKKIVRWLEQVAPDAHAIYLVGDLFEFWHEYRTVVPKGFTRLLGLLARLRDADVPIFVFTGNHDLWMYGYFEDELGIPVYRQPRQLEILNKQFLIGHGDGLGPNDYGYKCMKKVFRHPLCQWLFRWLHPDWGVRLAYFSSGKSRAATSPEEFRWLGESNEWLLQYCHRKIALGIEPDFFVFGHRHLPIDWRLNNGKSRYINLGDWLWHYSFAEFDGDTLHLQFFENQGRPISNWLH